MTRYGRESRGDTVLSLARLVGCARDVEVRGERWAELTKNRAKCAFLAELCITVRTEILSHALYVQTKVS